MAYLIRIRKLIHQSVLIKGEIVDFKKKAIQTGSGIRSFIPIIEFNDNNGGLVKKIEANSGFSEGKYSIGDTIEAWYYSNDDKNELIINNWFSKWGSIIFIIIGIVTIIIGELFSFLGTYYNN